MMNTSRVRYTLRARFRQGSGLSAGNVFLQSENRKVPPRVLQAKRPLWVRETLFVTSESLGSTQLTEALGQVRYDVFTLAGHGTERGEDIALAIADIFEVPLSLQDSESSLIVTIDQTERQPGTIDPTDDGLGGKRWFQIPTVVSWRVYSAITVSP